MKIGFSMSHGNFISESIVFFTRKIAKIKPIISHSFSIFEKFNGIELAMSADELVSNLINTDRYRNNPEKSFRIYELPDRVSSEQRFQNVMKRQNQKVYPHLELIWFIYRWMRRLINPKWNGRNWFSYSYFCSEGVIWDLIDNGYGEYFEGIDPNTMDAVELENIIVKIPGAKLIEVWEKGIHFI